jgi:beta-lactamase class C
VLESNIVDFARWLQASMGARPDVFPASALHRAIPAHHFENYGGDCEQANSDAKYGLAGAVSTMKGGCLLVTLCAADIARH